MTPSALFDALGGKTPNRVLIDTHVIEGVYRLGRHPAGASCAPNESADPSCHPACPPADPNGACFGGQACVQGVCAQTIDPATCQNALFDPEDLGEGAMLYAQQSLPSPLRLTRRSASASAETIDETWAPRLQSLPRAKSDDGAWASNEPLTAMLNPYIVPQGKHCFEAPNACRNWDFAQYLVNLTARFFATEGRDLYYVSHPQSHGCLQNTSCSFFEPSGVQTPGGN